MSVYSRIKLYDKSKSTAQLKSVLKLEQGGIFHKARLLAEYFKGLAGGADQSDIVVNVGAVHATGLITMTDVPTADDTVSIANVTFTAKASGATGNEFNIGTGEEDTADNLAAAINASSDLADIVTAVSDGAGVVTLTVHIPGKMGNGVELSESMDNTTVTAFANGAEGTETIIELG